MGTVVRLADRRGLETRGIHPEPLTRGAFARLVYERVDRSWRFWSVRGGWEGVHEAFYGVPCGPVPPRRGPSGIVGDT